MPRPFWDKRFEVLPDGLFTSSGLVSHMEGTYDVIYCAGEPEYYLRHNRTARGALTLSSDGDILTGKIVMDPSMEPLDWELHFSRDKSDATSLL